MIVLSHRGPYRFERDEAGDGTTFIARRGAGGVVSALGPLLAERSDATWIAAALSDDDRVASRLGATRGLEVDLHLLDLDQVQHRLHYDVVANGVLWFWLHGMFDRVQRPRFDMRFREAWQAFIAINEEFADAAAKIAEPNDVVLVQDYQLMLVPQALRARRPDLRIVHFTHTPFAPPDDMGLLPEDVARELCTSLAPGPAGFHTARWGDAFKRSARATLGRRATIAAPFAASLGPDVAALDATAASPATRAAAATLADAVGDRLVVLRADRIEPSKNIVRGFVAYDRLLEARPGLRGRVVFVAMLYASRQGLAEYLAYGNQIEQIVARVNDR